jgi:hypothetical protein
MRGVILIALAALVLLTSACAPVLPVAELRYGQGVDEVKDAIGYRPDREVAFKAKAGSMLALEYRLAPYGTAAGQYWLLFYRGKLWQHGDGDLQRAKIAGRNYPYGGAAGNRVAPGTDADLVTEDLRSTALLPAHRATRARGGSLLGAARVRGDRQTRLGQQIAAERYRTQALIEAEQAQRLRLLGAGSHLGDVHRTQIIRPSPMNGRPIQCTTVQHGSFSAVDCR